MAFESFECDGELAELDALLLESNLLLEEVNIDLSRDGERRKQASYTNTTNVSRHAGETLECDSELAELHVLLQQSALLLGQSRESERLKGRAKELKAMCKRRGGNAALERDDKLLELNALLQESDESANDVGEMNEIRGGNMTRLESQVEEDRGELAKQEELVQNRNILEKPDNPEARKESKDAGVALLKCEVDKMAEVEQFVQSLTRTIERLKKKVKDLEEHNEKDDATAVLLKLKVKERDGKLAELEQLVRNEIEKSKEKTSKINALEEQLKCSSKKTKELKYVIQTSQEDSKKYSSEINNLRNRVQELILQKEEVRLAVNRDCIDKVAYDALAQSVIDLENKLMRYREKHQNSRKVSNALAQMVISLENELKRPNI